MLFIRDKKRKYRSPIRDEEAALPLPGRSCRVMLDDEITDFSARLAALMTGAGVGIGIVLGAMLEAKWIGYLGSCVLLAGALWSIKCFWKVRQRIAAIQLGQEGEIYVAQLLETLRGQFAAGECAVFHDLPGHANPKAKPGMRWNIDHVVVGPMGVVAFETKTWRKRNETGNNQKLHYDGERLTLNGHTEMHQGPATLRQADRSAERVRAILKDTTGRDYPVRAAVVFPGWYVVGSLRTNSNERWVANPKALVQWIAREPKKLSQEDIALVTNRLTIYARHRSDD